MGETERILVCGGRGYDDKRRLEGILQDEVDRTKGDLIIICGYDPDNPRFQGADELAFKFARDRRIPAFPFPAPWGKHGRAAGPLRNRRMRDCGRPHKGIAFPGGNGTAHMIGLLREREIPVDEIKDTSHGY